MGRDKSTRPERRRRERRARREAAATEERGERATAARGGRERGGPRSRPDAQGRERREKPERRRPTKPSEKADEARARQARAGGAPAAAAAADGAQARLFVSLGKKHGVSADDLRALLAGPIGGDKARIGSVSLRDSHAHVRVPEDAVDAIIAGVHGTLHNDHDVTVERARA